MLTRVSCVEGEVEKHKLTLRSARVSLQLHGYILKMSKLGTKTFV